MKITPDDLDGVIYLIAVLFLLVMLSTSSLEQLDTLLLLYLSR